MLFVHDFLKQSPFDLYDLHLFQLVVQHRSFTKAAASAGLTQSAITRQVQGLEDSLGVNLFDRTTRSVNITPAGRFLFREATTLLGNADQSVRALRQEFAGIRREVRIGVSRSISQSYLPGLLHANLREAPDVTCRVSYQNSGDILRALEANDLDLGVLCPPRRLPRGLKITHRFDDTFTLILPADSNAKITLPKSRAARAAWASGQRWLLLDERTQTGDQLRAWLKRQGWPTISAMQLDSFDLIIQLVALGMGASLVPIRALALFGQKRRVQRVNLLDRFVRELVVVTRHHRKPPQHLAEFVQRILFHG